METLAAAVTIGQSFAYCAALMAGLANLHHYLKHGQGIWQQHRDSIYQLQLIVADLGGCPETSVKGCLGSTLTSIYAITQRLIKLLCGGKSLKTSLVLFAREKAINNSFAELERQKTTLILHLQLATRSSTMPRFFNTEKPVMRKGLPAAPNDTTSLRRVSRCSSNVAKCDG